jgi:23S rRNA (adenine2030-N6)-methyltransferase
MAWHPIKDGLIGAALGRAARALPKTLHAEFSPFERDNLTLSGGGLLVVNAPWKLDERLAALAAELAPRLGDGRGTSRIEWVTPG